VEKRFPFQIKSYYKKNQGDSQDFFTGFDFKGVSLTVNQHVKKSEKELPCFEQEMLPCFQLFIIGAEHDAVQLCTYASHTGWEVTVVTDPREGKTKKDFPGIHRLISVGPEAFCYTLDQQTAVVIMTHSFVKDLQYLSEDFLEQIHGPAGIDIGAETPQEVAISILSEVLSVVNDKECPSLKNKMGNIHS